MSEFWEQLYREQGTLWDFQPADSAIVASELFKHHKFSSVLIPGSGYGRNAKLFIEHGFTVTGIEVSQTAIDLANESGIAYTSYQNSLTEMPLSNDTYDGIFCYATLHLFDEPERQKIINACYKQLNPGGLMIFYVVSKNYHLYGTGNPIGEDRFELVEGLSMYYYDPTSLAREFKQFEKLKIGTINEEVKYEEGHDPIPGLLAIVQK